jgi:ectoine hydroxylase-related dioxygenase (phytanoyl-CoA dioxygenase family)
MNDMKGLSEQGYTIIPDVLSTEECDDLLEELANWTVGRSRAGVRHLMRCPAISSLAHDTRLQTLAKAALKETTNPYRATLFEKTQESNWLVAWHQDSALPLEKKFVSPEWGPWSQKSGITYAHAPAWALDRIITLRIQLDPCTQDDGPLRVIPGSHLKGVLSDSIIHLISKHEPLVECLVPQGGILVMKPLIIHASSKSKGSTPRRVLHIEYAPASGISESIKLAVA